MPMQTFGDAAYQGETQGKRPLTRGEADPRAQQAAPDNSGAYAGPGMDIDASKMGGATDDGATTIEIGPDMQPRRVPRAPGPQSMNDGTMGDLMASSGTDADTLVKMVRQDRLARHAASGAQVTPTFGEVSDNARMQQAEQQGQAQQADADQQAQIAAIQKQIRFLVDTRTGEIEPVLPDQPDPRPGPHEIVMSMGDDPTQPNIISQGKGVTAQAIARLGDPKRGIQPALRKGYKVPEQYAHVAEALGLGPQQGAAQEPQA